MPYYPQLMGKLNLKFDETHDLLRVPFGDGCEWAKVNVLRQNENLTWYFLEYHRFFDRPNLYDWNGQEYADNAQRYIFLCRAAWNSRRISAWRPIFSTPTTGMQPSAVFTSKADSIPVMNSSATPGPSSRSTTSVIRAISIREISIGPARMGIFQLPLPGIYDRLNFLKGGIMCADMVSTVSPTYAREILSPEYGFGLDGALRHRASTGRLRGILNGIDSKVWNPAHDKFLPAVYSAEKPDGKAECRRALQENSDSRSGRMFRCSP